MYPEEYVQYLVHFHGDRDYFECHEILEEFWKQSTDCSKNSIWVGFILLAVSAYHHRRSNYQGAKRTLEKAAQILTIQEDELPILGLDKPQLFFLLKERLSAIKNCQPYKSIQLPITDSKLIKKCQEICTEKGFIWKSESNLENLDIVHRHKRRDRTEVITERLMALKAKKGND